LEPPASAYVDGPITSCVIEDRMLKSAPAKPPEKPDKSRPAFSAFGVTVDANEKKSGEKPPMSRERKAMLALGALVPVIGLVLWLQYRPTNDLDSEAASNAAVREVVKLQEKKDTAGLTQMTRNDDPMVARRAVQALGDIGGANAVRDYLDDKRTEVRYVAVSALGSDGDPSALPVLSKYTQDPAPDVRVAAVRSISNIRDFTIFDHLIPCLNDPDISVRRSALSAIEDRVGLKFPDFKPDDTASKRAAAVARMRAQVSKMKQVFDQANAFEVNRLQQQQKRR
jgi:HEAT repeat protein